MDAKERAILLKNWAEEAGFARCGVAVLQPAEHGRVFLEWLAAGRQAGMRYLERRIEARLDPRAIFPGATSVLCVALQYSEGALAPEPPGDLWPRVSRYARGADYHDLMGKRLDRLSRRVREAFPGSRTRWYVDTGPVLERDLAAAAGLGAIGKNTCLLDPRCGSWFFLGQIFTDLTLAADQPIADLCGSCTRCLDACPTGALPEPYTLDSNRCISYWTIEHRGEVPESVRPHLGEWVFGCDICQDVCPHNEQRLPDVSPEFELGSARKQLTLAGLLSMDSAAYSQTFRGSPMKRAKLAGLKRNVAVTMGNSGNPSYVEPLVSALKTEDTEVRRHAVWALGQLGG
ncbi:MAG: tRNA epoxyqueuosine(34) reductase QueG, partial [Acidobacteriota bacterium]|nr:tRNA epoxyqueuosine(34) reductase QueG [Acidobacteriota bacterium]